MALVALTTPQQQPTITARPLVPSCQTPPADADTVPSLAAAKPGETVRGFWAGHAQPKSVNRYDKGHGKPDIFGQLAAQSQPRRGKNPRPTPHPHRIHEDGQGGYRLGAYTLGSQAHDQADSLKSAALGAEGEREDSIRPVVFAGTPVASASP